MMIIIPFAFLKEMLRSCLILNNNNDNDDDDDDNHNDDNDNDNDDNNNNNNNDDDTFDHIFPDPPVLHHRQVTDMRLLVLVL